MVRIFIEHVLTVTSTNSPFSASSDPEIDLRAGHNHTWSSYAHPREIFVESSHAAIDEP